MANLRCSVQLLVFFANLLIIGSKESHSWYPENHVALFVFGDSLFDAGNNNFLKNASRANFFPYGKSFFSYPTGRFSDGRIIPDFIAGYLKLPFIPPYLQPGNHKFTNGVNFASGGAGALVETHKGKTINLKTQVHYFKKMKMQLRQRIGTKATKKLLSKAIYIFSIGTNDYAEPVTTNSSLLHLYSEQEYVGMVIGNLTSVLKEINRNGGRKFGFVSMGPIGCLPGMRALNQWHCVKQVNAVAKLHNKELKNVLKQLQSQLQGFHYSYFNFYDSINERIDNPSKFGFKEAKWACCGSGPYRAMGNCGGKGAHEEYELCENPSEYLFFDGHPTEKADRQFAKLMWSGKPKLTWPCNLKQLYELVEAKYLNF